MQPLKGKTALVTGGSRGIGAASARRLAREGANVAVTYGKSAAAAEAVVKELLALGVKAKAYLADAAKPESLEGVISQVVKDFGSLDILVNNAGVFETGMIGEVNRQDYERIMKVNVESVFVLSNAAAKVMKPGSRIINISSGLGERATGPGMSIYCASKFAVTGFSRAWAKDLGQKGILVNAIQPGPINTEMNPETGEFSDFMKSQTALGRYGQPEEIAGAVAFLAGPDSAYVTGARLDVDGGWNA